MIFSSICLSMTTLSKSISKSKSIFNSSWFGLLGMASAGNFALSISGSLSSLAALSSKDSLFRFELVFWLGLGSICSSSFGFGFGSSGFGFWLCTEFWFGFVLDMNSSAGFILDFGWSIGFVSGFWLGLRLTFSSSFGFSFGSSRLMFRLCVEFCVELVIDRDSSF